MVEGKPWEMLSISTIDSENGTSYGKGNPARTAKSLGTLKKIAWTVTLGGLLFGVDTGIINGSITYMASPEQLNLSPYEEGLVTSGITLGAAFGAVIIGRLSDIYGRKKTLWALSVVFLVTTLACSLAPNAPLMILFRFLLGLAVGGVSVIVPTYLSEIAAKELRGRIVTHNEFMITTGQLLAFVVNAVLGNLFPDMTSIWRYMIAFGMIPSILLFIGMFRVPESPRWEIMRGREDSARKILASVRSSDERANAEIEDIKEKLAELKLRKKVTLHDLLTPRNRHAILIGIGLGIMMQFVGVNIMMYYGTTILSEVGFGRSAALVANIGNGLVSVLAVVGGIKLMAKRNRRRMLITGICGTTCCMALVTLSFVFLGASPALPYIILILTMTFLGFYQSSVGTVVWLILSEIFPQNIRGLGMGISTFFLWLANFLVGFLFPIMLNRLGRIMTFGFFTVTNVLSLIFAVRHAPETRDKSLEEIYMES